MPTITVNLGDLGSLAGQRLDVKELESYLPLAKAELKDFDERSGDLRIELTDTNRPDLWCAEGIARQIRSRLAGRPAAYPFFGPGQEQDLRIEVDPRLKDVRPHVAAFAASGGVVSEHLLKQLIQAQESFCENFGRKRSSVAIGIYNASRLRFPIRYRAAGPREVSFVPLGLDRELTLEEILEEHPKGREYAHIVRKCELYPLLADSQDVVLSFPPIINSRETGEVQPGDTDLFVEATGLDIRQLVLVMNIMASNFADRGWQIRCVTSCFPYDTAMGREVTAPRLLNSAIRVDPGLVSSALGNAYTPGRIAEGLRSYGVEADVSGGMVDAVCPAYRDDYLHTMDAVEDFAVSQGYRSFEPVLPSSFTVGKVKPITLLVDRVRDHMVGLGCEEIYSNILSNRTSERDHMLIPGEPIVEIENVMSETYSVMRSSLIPSLLRVEGASGKAAYPHKIFEAGEVCLWDPGSEYGSRTEHRLAVLWASADSGFSEVHSILDMLMYCLGRDYSLVPASRAFYFEGRCGEVVRGETRVGHIGEVHPEVLTNFGIAVPCAAFEIVLELV